jgi:hypothetical protein
MAKRTKPNIVEHSDYFLEFEWNVHVDILVKAGLEAASLRHWWPVVLPH